MKIPELCAMASYCIMLVAVGIYFFLKDRKKVSSSAEKDYFLGGRKMGGMVCALSAGASDMSAWVLMGLPGAIYLHGMGQVWIAVGLILGTVAAWIFVAPQLRRYSIAANDAITIPQFLTNRFLTVRKEILVVSALVFMVTYCVYAASSIYACGTLFNTVLGMDQTMAMRIATAVIVVYTLLGGYNAVCWTDFFQGLLMLAALMFIPIMVLVIMSTAGFAAPASNISANFFNFFSSGSSDWQSWSEILSGLGWGLGYFGMPHIIIRYISIKNEKEMRKSQIIGCSWIVIILGTACAIGLLGRFFFGDTLAGSTDESTLIFIQMVRDVFDWIGCNIGMVTLWVFFAGLLLSAILAAAMSTADSQLLASSSAFASDLYKPIFRPSASDKEMLWAGRLIVAIISIAAFIIASSPDCKGIMGLVSCAWAAFGAAFGPVILLALYWKRFTYWGAFAGIVAGFATDIIWYIWLTEKTGIYEILPGFAAGLTAAVAVSLLTPAPSSGVAELFALSRKPTD